MSSNHVFNISVQLMTSSTKQDRVNSNDESKGTKDIISEGTKQFKVENEHGMDRVNFCIQMDVTVSNISAATT